MENNILDLVSRWDRMISMKSFYAVSASRRNLTDFSDLVKQTFDVIKKAKNEYIYPKKYPERTQDVFSYLYLISVVSQYCINDCAEEYEQNKIYSATRLITEQLMSYAKWPGDVRNENGEEIYFDTEKELNGTMEFLSSDYIINRQENDEDKTYVYNVYEGSFDEILELIQRMNDDTSETSEIIESIADDI